MSEILEKIITQKITDRAEINNIINTEHVGFRKHHNTHDKIFQFTETAQHTKNMKTFTGAVWTFKKLSIRFGTPDSSTHSHHKAFPPNS